MKRITLLLLAIMSFNLSGIAQKDLTPEDKDYYKYNWKLTDVYADWDAWQKDCY